MFDCCCCNREDNEATQEIENNTMVSYQARIHRITRW
jgi:hypothetical protein